MRPLQNTLLEGDLARLNVVHNRFLKWSLPLRMMGLVAGPICACLLILSPFMIPGIPKALVFTGALLGLLWSITTAALGFFMENTAAYMDSLHAVLDALNDHAGNHTHDIDGLEG